MAKNPVWRGAFWLSLGSLISKLIGAVYRIFLPRILGDYGVGLFQMAYPLYAVLLAIWVNGIPTALSKLTAEKLSRGDDAGAEALSGWAQVGLGLVGLALAAAMGWGAPWIARVVFVEPDAMPAIRALAPALAFVALEASFRGYFQGHQEMVPTALSQIVEQLVRVGVMFPLAVWLVPRGVALAAAGATLGAPVGAVAGLGYLVWRRRRGGSACRLSWPIPVPDLARLFRVALPMSLSGLLFPLMFLADSLFVPQRLRATGMSMRQATAAFGRLSGEAMPLINLTMVVGAALAVSLVPAVARAVTEQDAEQAAGRVASAVHLIWLIGLPMAGGLIALATPLTTLLYGDGGSASALEVLAMGSSILAIQQVLGSSLQAAGHGWIPVKNLVAGAVVKFFLTYWLTPLPHLGIRGAAMGSVAASVVTAYLNWRDWTRIVPVRKALWADAGWPLAGTVVMVMAIRTWLAWRPVGGPLGLMAGAVAIGMAVYGLLMVAAGQGAVVAGIWRER